MEFMVKGRWVSVDASQQPDDLLRRADEEITTAAVERGIELPGRAGRVAIVGSFSDVESSPLSFGNAEEDPEASADVPALEPVTIENLQMQLFSTTFLGYRSVIGSINKGNKWRKSDAMEPASALKLGSEFEAWWDNSDKQESIAAIQEVDPSVRFTLIATPDVSLTAKQLIATIKAFAKELQREADVNDMAYFHLEPDEVSAPHSEWGKDVNFSLIPSRYTPGMTHTPDRLRQILADLQGEGLNRDLHVPTLQDAVTYWHTLRAQQIPLQGDAIFNRTCITHFDIGYRPLGDGQQVLRSGINRFGVPHITGVFTNNVTPGRLAIG